MLFQIDDEVGHRGEFRCLRYEELLRVAADAQHFSFHSHEHPLALRIEWPVGVIGEERLVTTPRVLRKIQRDRARQSLVDPNAFAGTHLRDALEARAPADEEQYEPMRPKRS